MYRVEIKGERVQEVHWQVSHYRRIHRVTAVSSSTQRFVYRAAVTQPQSEMFGEFGNWEKYPSRPVVTYAMLHLSFPDTSVSRWLIIYFKCFKGKFEGFQKLYAFSRHTTSELSISYNNNYNIEICVCYSIIEIIISPWLEIMEG